MLFKDNEPNKSWTDLLILLNCGGIAGCASWAVSYPYDILNTMIKNNQPHTGTIKGSFKFNR